MEKVYIAGLALMVATSVVGGVYLVGQWENRHCDIAYSRVIAAILCFSAGVATYAKTAVVAYGMTYSGFVFLALVCGVIITVISSAVYHGTYGGFSKSL